MMRIRNGSFALACAGMIAAALPAAAHACSMAPFPGFRPGLQLIVTATADTLQAGPGSVQYRVERGDTERAVYGQVVRLERAGGADAAGLPAETDRVVLVPWGYDPGCQTTRWSESARWIDPGSRGLLWSTLRPRAQWVDGLPTFDVGDAYQAPYPGRTREMPADSMLSVEQMFDLVALLPEYEAYDADPEGAVRPLLAWARAHPGLARLYPARVMVGDAEHGVRYVRLKRVRPPLAGTYRFSVSVDGDAPRTFFARTEPAPTTEWNPWRKAEDPFFPAADAPLHGYSLLLAAATAADSLSAGRVQGREGYVSVLAAPDSTVGGVQFWRGQMELRLAFSALPGDSVLARAARAEGERYARRSQAGEPIEVLGRLLLRPDGSVAMEQTSVLDDGRVVTIRGERISRVTIGGGD